MTKIAIIGTGRMATGLGAGWARAGHEVIYGSRDPAGRSDQIEEVEGAALRAIPDALSQAEVVLLAMPFTAIEPFAREHADLLRGKVVVDMSNPFKHLPDNRIAAAEITAAAIGEGARVVAAFKDNFWQTLLDPINHRGVRHDVHFAGDDEQAKQVIAQLITEIGFQPVDCGALQNARVLDAMVPLLVELDRRYGGGMRSSWKFLT